MNPAFISIIPALCIIGFILLLILLKPLKKLFGFGLRAAVAILSFTALNGFSALTGLAVGVNFFTVATVTFLGIPGFFAVAISSLILR